MNPALHQTVQFAVDPSIEFLKRCSANDQRGLGMTMVRGLRFVGISSLARTVGNVSSIVFGSSGSFGHCLAPYGSSKLSMAGGCKCCTIQYVGQGH